MKNRDCRRAESDIDSAKDVLVSEIESLEQNLDLAKETIADLEDRIEALGSRITKLENENRKLSSQI